MNLKHFRCEEDINLRIINPYVIISFLSLPDADLTEPEEDLALLAACSHSVMTVGSFGFWASYLAGGRVVYPLLSRCTHTPYVHPDSLGSRGYPNWLPLHVN